MKSWTNLYPEICSLENLYKAARKARKRKSRKEDVERFELHRERFLHQLREELLSENWKPSPYHKFQIHDPKTRTISAAPYRDRIVHHALCNIIAPLIERRFIYDSYSCRKGKGTQAGRERCRKYTNRYSYVLKCDIRKYFESIDHEILMDKIGRVIRCKPTAELCRKIVSSGSVEAVSASPISTSDFLIQWEMTWSILIFTVAALVRAWAYSILAALASTVLRPRLQQNFGYSFV